MIPLWDYDHNLFDAGMSLGFEETHVHHKKLRDTLAALQSKWIVTYNFSKGAQDLYKDYNITMINQYGADSVRLFILSDSPPEKDVQWSDEGMKSSYKFIQKLWILNQKILEEVKKNHPKKKENQIEIIASKFVDDVKKNIENFSYNKIIANFHEVYAKLNKILNGQLNKEELIENYSNILVTMSPVIPHFANECLEMLKFGNKEGKHKWPLINKKILIRDKVNFVVQVNGKTRYSKYKNRF